MLVAAESAGLVHLVGAEFRWATGQRLAARAVAEGAIGDPRMATFLLHIPLLADPRAEVPAWWSDASQGGGWLGAHATHLVDQVRTMLGEFDRVSAGLVSVSERSWSVEDAYTVHFRTRSGVDGVMQSSSASWGPMLIHTRIAGTGGTLSIAGDTVSVADSKGQRTLEVPPDMVAAAAVPPPADLLVTEYDLLHATGIDRVRTPAWPPPFVAGSSVWRWPTNHRFPPSPTVPPPWRCSTPPAGRPPVPGGNRWSCRRSAERSQLLVRCWRRRAAPVTVPRARRMRLPGAGSSIRASSSMRK